MLCPVDYYFGEGLKKPFEKPGKRVVNSSDTRVTGIGNHMCLKSILIH